ncbi:MAG: ParB/Srx family N-terminal domain-containing protein [Leptospirillum sp.]
MNLLKDIARNGLLPEQILVSKNDSGKWVVRDGNRRVSALKILDNPNLCNPDSKLINQINQIISQPGIEVVSQVDCLACDDESKILDYLERKHTGENEGIGQRNWTALLKSLFNIETGSTDQYKRAAQVLTWLEKHDLQIDDEFEISTLQRGLNSETLRLIGFDVVGDELVPSLPEHQTYALATKVVMDIASGTVNVKRDGGEGSIYTADSQLAYFQAIRKTLGPEPLGGGPNGPFGKQPTPETTVSSRKSSPLSSPQDRKCLFGRKRNSSPGFYVPDSEPKVQSIIVELRKLDPHETPLSVTMLFRALIELSNNHYQEKKKLPKEQSLHKSIASSADRMLKENTLSKEQHEVVMRYTRGEDNLLHVKNIQSYIHKTTSHPSGKVINTVWDEISCFIITCWTT